MNRRGLYRLLADLQRELAVPIVLVTHDLGGPACSPTAWW
jgi:molybdate transport system ATP-binding protein